MKSSERILLIQPAFIGDAILVSSLAETLHAGHPGVLLTVLVRAGNEGLFHGHPFLEVWVWEKRNRKYRNLWSLLKRIRRARFDLVVNVHRFGTSGLLTAFSGAGETRGFKKNPLSFLFSRSYDHGIAGQGAKSVRHEIDRNYQLVSDFCSTLLPPRMYPSAEAVSMVDQVLGGIGDFVVMAPASVWFTKAWPEERWVQLLSMHSDEPVFMIGGPGDSALAARIMAASGHSAATNLCGVLSLQASAELMRRARMNYVNDSAPLHLCSAVNAPVTAIFCSTVPEFGFGPVQRGARVIEYTEPLPCRPCGLHGKNACPKGHFLCGLGISATRVKA